MVLYYDILICTFRLPVNLGMFYNSASYLNFPFYNLPDCIIWTYFKIIWFLFGKGMQISLIETNLEFWQESFMHLLRDYDFYASQWQKWTYENKIHWASKYVVTSITLFLGWKLCPGKWMLYSLLNSCYFSIYLDDEEGAHVIFWNYDCANIVILKIVCTAWFLWMERR